MVLDNSSAIQADSFNDDAPTSDADPYSSSDGGNQEQRYHIDYASLPKPIPIIGPLLGYNHALFTKVLGSKLQTSQKALNRPLTQEEAAALAFWTSKQISILSYGTPVGVAGAFWRAWGTRGTFRFPFYQPNLETFQPEVFPPKLATLRGNRAVMAWHAFRALAYGGFGQYVGLILMGSYSMTVAGVGEMSDKRLKEYTNAVRQHAQQRRGALTGQAQVGNAGASSTDTRSRQNNPVNINESGNSDDASPTGGMYFDEGVNSSTTTDIKMVPESTQNAERKTSRWPREPRPSPPASTQEPREEQFSDFDDASPTGGQGTQADTTADSGSAWDRIRRGAGTKPTEQGAWSKSNAEPAGQNGQSAWSKLQNTTKTEQQKEPSSKESFSFSKADEERNLPRAEAQKEFDARIERERRGGDFSSGSGDQRRW